VVGCGVLLPTFDPFRTGDIPILAAARRAEELSFDSAWVGDHLACPAPNLDGPTSLAGAAAVTNHIELGFSVLLLGLRSPAWTAKQLVTLQAISHGRLTLGVGVGGEFPQEFAAAGVPVDQRGARLDQTLGVLPALLTGQSATIMADGGSPGLEIPALEPALPHPPRILVGGRGERALRRVARYADGWLPMWLSPRRLGERAERLAELAAAEGRARPSLTLLVGVHVDDDERRAARAADRHLQGQYGLGLSAVERWTPLGRIERVVEQLQEYVAVGVSEFILFPLASDQLAQYERLAEVRTRLRSLEVAR
jgi:alkanesulfonate monooxygenase SsuD/methylene tetrahydromethanopterin reductase-like flavin-dependent oxidoreductase (luciferase family)